MPDVLQKPAMIAAPTAERIKLPVTQAAERATGEAVCFHCGAPAPRGRYTADNHSFCCAGCRTVFELLTENGLTDFYQLADTAGVQVRSTGGQEEFTYLDDPEVRRSLVDFAEGGTTRVTFRIPAIHCIACVWLLENLFRLKPGIGRSQVQFARKEVTITFKSARVRLSEVVALLVSLGYEPDLRFSDLDETPVDTVPRRLWLQLGIAGFAFGNTMLFSIAVYLGLDAIHGPLFQTLFGWTSLVLSLPVFFYSAGDYWRAAWASLREHRLTIEVPIAVGIAALFGQSVFEVISGRGEGYFDSLAGLLFFLLCGKLFQQKTYARLAFDRDYKAFFPLAVTRKEGAGESRVALSALRIGDHLLLRHGELIPADARLIAGSASIDYSFVTGEADPVSKQAGDHLYAGGRQTAGAIEIELVKPVSQSYLTSLWSQDAFRKEQRDSLDDLTNRYSRRFSLIVILIATGAGLFWLQANPALALKAFISVLIVACPCALALAAPFTLGTAHRMLGRRHIFLKGPQVIESLANVDTVVFDKTGTLTVAGGREVEFQGAPLSRDEQHWVYSLTRHSTHPVAARIGDALVGWHGPEIIRSFRETTGCGIEGSVARNEVWLGSAPWLAARRVTVPAESNRAGSTVHLAINGVYRGTFVLPGSLRNDVDAMITRLGHHHHLALLSGDNERELGKFLPLFGGQAELRFHQTPQAKLEYVRDLQAQGRHVMMVGDGLNDAGALKQSNVGVAVVDRIGAFSPASDIILAADALPQLPEALDYARASVRVVRLSFLISSLYNVVGIGIAASGRLSPIVCAVLMPLSSITVVAFACGLAGWLGRKTTNTI